MAGAPRHLIPIVCWAILLTAGWAMAQDTRPATRPIRQAQGQPASPRQPATTAPSHPVDIILARPTGTSIVLSVLCEGDIKGVIVYGTQKADPAARTEARSFKKGQPEEVLLEKLKPDTRYYYQLLDAAADKPLVEGSFHTQRAPLSTFTFTVTADSHLDEHTDLDLYQRALGNALADAPDFHIDLGDTFMTEKHESRQNAAGQYLAQRYYFGQLGRCAPLFLVLGNHDGEDGRLLRGGADSLAVWSNTMRKRYFPNPVPDGFYAGSATKHPQAGLLEDYYAWEWGDALFVVLDPFWFTPSRRGRRDNWNRTLGAEQYQWLKRTVEDSRAKFKFVFIHHLVGGADDQCRGGAEAAAFYEWGGRNADGSDSFRQNRPGWPAPIHQLLVRNKVGVVFHGHDHLYAKQDLDGIVYQEVPQPGWRGNGVPPRWAAEYGYVSGTLLGSSGHVRVTVGPEKVRVEYVRCRLSKDATAEHPDGEIAFSYEIAASRAGSKNSPATGEASAPAEAPPVTGPIRQAQGQPASPRKPPPPRRSATTAPSDPADIILGRPTGTSIVLSVLCGRDITGVVAYGTQKSDLAARTEARSFKKGQPEEVALGKLKPDRRYYYQLLDAAADKPLVDGSFHTQRAQGSTFVFDVQGDSHPERPDQNDPALYAQTLRAAAADRPDFYMTIGDDFSVDTLRTVNAETVSGRYSLQRPFLSIVGQSSPLFLVGGNHEQAALCNLDGTANNVAVWAQKARNRFFPQPAPDDFYTGDATPVQFIGTLRDYCAWTWGDAIFVVIDPYWHSPKPVDNALGGGEKARRDLWEITLGDEQYKWLKKTLESSRAKYKFVFAHHVRGTGRGGVEQAGLFEWGGKNKKGVDEFARRRPGWELPIHQLMAANGVTIFFQGHDHVFARQQADGVVYQTLPEPADPNYALHNKEAYLSGDVLPNSGYVRVTVGPEKVRVEYVRSWLPKDATAEHPDGEIAFSYEIAASRPASRR